MAAKWRKVRIKIPDDLSAKDREGLAFDVLEFIRNRTEKGKDKNNRSFKKYSTAYTESLDFSIAGKSKKPNLKLSGDMLDDMDLLSHKKGSILIGYENGSENNAKADGNITGSYGRPSGNSKHARDFLGITKKDLKKVIKVYDDEVISG